jgi:DNA-binding MarR family transcriptional regulator
LSVVYDQHETELNSEIRIAEDIAAIPSLWQTVSNEALVLLQELRLCPVTARQERILRTIGSKYYKRGYCFAKQETIATALGSAKSTIQLDLDELEARGLLAVRRRPGTSNVTILAPGLIEALRTMRLERRQAEFVARRGTVPILKHIDSYKKLAVKAMDDLAAFARDTVAVASTKFSEITSPKVVVPQPMPDEKPGQNRASSSNRPKAVLQPRISTTNYISAKATSVDAFEKNELTKKLHAAGVSIKQCGELICIFGTERAERNLALGLHLKATNPGGFLSTAIREDYAASSITPGSEAATVRNRENNQKQYVQTQSFGTLAKKEAIVPPQPVARGIAEIEATKFAELPLEQKNEYEEQAKAIVEKVQPSWIQHLFKAYGFQHPAVQGYLKTKAIEIWRRYTQVQSAGAY